ncbi:hypothetical protein CSV67_02950 [Sporosarcina sp. P2]|uniref:GIY-YIG nuclease family protein n=1 Tax=Sporosarcina sp. P2 TaxID=2048251 RepID=UPI000C16A340|nr:GIY-YIG nuclease family protein [Sporosarcina sp. P2]PID03615.1 hypothetical protein CSV67_02950 [Sporosarcina sp. P2]
MIWLDIETDNNWDYVYFVQAEIGGPIKIGSASNVSKRIKALQTGNPEKLRVLHTTTGGKRLEFHLHRKFTEHHKFGEWFYNSEEIYELIAKLKYEDKHFGELWSLSQFARNNYSDISDDELNTLIAISNSFSLNPSEESIEKRIKCWCIIDNYLEYQKKFPRKVIDERLLSCYIFEGRSDADLAIRKERNIQLKNF